MSRRIRFNVLDRWGAQVGVVTGVVEAIHKDELNGEDSLTLVTVEPCLAKGQRVVWRDRFDAWHEHVVSEVTDIHADGMLWSRAWCENSMVEMSGDYIEERRLRSATSSTALMRALEPTRWAMGRVDVTGTATESFYHISAYEAIGKVVAAWGGEVSASIAVSGTAVSARKVNLQARRGDDTGKRFEWERDLASIERTVGMDDVATALYGYGKGLAMEGDEGEATGGYTRKITFGSVNGGRDYVADEAARAKWGLPDGKGGIKHAFGKVEFADCEDPSELLRLTREELGRRSKPQLSYAATVLDLADAGYDFEDVRTGDVVALVDRPLGERAPGRVLSVERHLLDEQATTVTMGNVARTVADVLKEHTTELSWMRDRTGAWDSAARAEGAWLEGVIEAANKQMDASGGYVYYEPGEGLVTYDRPRDQSPTMAIQIKGGGFRIANSKRSNGDWDWRTFGTGEGFTADCITAGVIRGGSNYWNLGTGDLVFKQGTIQSADGKSSWNMTTGELVTDHMVARDMDATGSIVSTGRSGAYGGTVRIKNGYIELEGSSRKVVFDSDYLLIGPTGFASASSAYAQVTASTSSFELAALKRDLRLSAQGYVRIAANGESGTGFTGPLPVAAVKNIDFVGGLCVGWS